MLGLDKTTSFDELLSQVLTYWPDVIEINARLHFNNGSIRYDDLVILHDKVDFEIDKYQDDLLRVMDWALYKTLHKCAEYQDYLRPRELNREYLRKIFENDLFSTKELENIYDRYRR